MVRHRPSDFAERRRNKNTTAAAVSAFSVAGAGGEPNKGRKLSSFWSPSEMIGERTAKHKPLHNFALPRLWWGSQTPIHCMKAADHSTLASSSSSISADHLQSGHRLFNRASFTALPETEEEENGEGIEAVREKLMLDLKTETDKIRKELLKEDDDDRVEAAMAAAAVLKEGEFGGGLTDVIATVPSKKDGAAETRPWNLRTRRAACRVPASKNDSPARRVDGVAGKKKAWQVKEKEREKFSLVLKRKEIEEDFKMLTSRRPPRRPKKRPRAVQKQLDMLFPGSRLTEITADAYKVVELPNDGK